MSDSSKPVPHGLKYDPEFGAFWKSLGDAVVPPKYDSAIGLRKNNETFMSAMFSQLPKYPNIITTKYKVPSFDGVELDLARYSTAEQLASTDKPQPALLYFHGGGIISGNLDIFGPNCAHLAANSGVQVFYIEYRLAPEHPFPTPVEDCYAALQWLIKQSKELGVDPTRIGLLGDSGGACLTLGVTLMARDRGLEPQVKKQILVYPMVDDRAIAALSAPDSPRSPLLDFASIPLPDLKVCWEAYIGDKFGGPDVSPYAAPARAADLRGLPSTYIDVGGVDIFRDETYSLAARLAAAHVETEFHSYPGLPHGFEMAAHVDAVKRATEGRIRVIKGL